MVSTVFEELIQRSAEISEDILRNDVIRTDKLAATNMTRKSDIIASATSGKMNIALTNKTDNNTVVSTDNILEQTGKQYADR